MKIAIVGGAGPSGKMAAWACMQYGHEPVLYDVSDRASGNAAIFYLHSSCNIPGLQRGFVNNAVMGGIGRSKDELTAMYRDKLYPGEPEIAVSIDNLPPIDECWEADKALTFIDSILPSGIHLEKADAKTLARMSATMPVITTVPMPAWGTELELKSRPAYVAFRMPGGYLSGSEWYHGENSKKLDNYCLYNPYPSAGWYRTSCVYGNLTTEWANLPQDITDFIKLNKVIGPSYSQDELKQAVQAVAKQPIDGPVLFTGRFGAWDKSCLVDGVYYKTLSWLYAL